MRLLYERRLNARGVPPESEEPSLDPTGGRSTHISPTQAVRSRLRASLPLTSQARSYYTRESSLGPCRGYGIGSAATFIGMTLGMKPPQYAITATVTLPDGAPHTFEDSLHLTPEDIKRVAQRPTKVYNVTEAGNYPGCFGTESCGSVTEAVVLEDPVVPCDPEQRPDEARPPLPHKFQRQAYERAGLMSWSAAECVNTRIENKIAKFASREEFASWRAAQKAKLERMTFVLPMQKLAEEQTRQHGFFIFDFGDDTWKSPAQYCHQTYDIDDYVVDLDVSSSDSDLELDDPEPACPNITTGFWCGLPYAGLRTQLTPQQRHGLLQYYLRLGRAPLPIQFWSPGDWQTFMHNNHDALSNLGGDCIPTAQLQQIMRRVHWGSRHTAQLPATGIMAAIAQDLWAQRICRGMPYELMPLEERVWGMPPWVMPSKLWPVYARTDFDWLRPHIHTDNFPDRYRIGCLPLVDHSKAQAIELADLMSDHPMAAANGELFCAIYPTSLVSRIMPPYSAGTLDKRKRKFDLPFVTYDFPASDRMIVADSTLPDTHGLTKPCAFGGDVGELRRFHGPNADLCHEKHIRMRHNAYPDGFPDNFERFTSLTEVLTHNGDALCEAEYDERDLFQLGHFAVPFYNRTRTAAFLHSLFTIDPHLAAAATFLAEGKGKGTQTLREYCKEIAPRVHATNLVKFTAPVEKAALALQENNFFLRQMLENTRSADLAHFPKYDIAGRALCKIKSLAKHLRGYTSVHFFDYYIVEAYARQGQMSPDLYSHINTGCKHDERLAFQLQQSPTASIIETQNYAFPLMTVIGITGARNEVVRAFTRANLSDKRTYYDTILFEDNAINWSNKLKLKRKRDDDLTLEQARSIIALQASKLAHAQAFFNKVNAELTCVITQEIPGAAAAGTDKTPKLLRFLSTVRTTPPDRYDHVDLQRNLKEPIVQLGAVADHTNMAQKPNDLSPAETYLASCDDPDSALDPVTRTTLMPGAQLIEDKLLGHINEAAHELQTQLKQLNSEDKPINKILL